MSGVLMAVGAGAQVLGGLSGRKSAKKAARKQAALDRANLKLMQLELDENVRRLTEENKTIEGTQRNLVGASGFASGGSLQQYMDFTKKTHTDNVDWMKTSGASRIAIGQREMNARKSMADSMADANFFSSITGAIGTGAMASGMYQKGGIDKKLFGWMGAS